MTETADSVKHEKLSTTHTHVVQLCELHSEKES